MKNFIADLHIHSRFSRATSKNLTLRNLAAWGEIKGIDVLATGDFTHPVWMSEIQEELEEEGNGLLRVKNSQEVSMESPWLERSLSGNVRFLLCTEISSIYKKGGKVRKNHNLVYMPCVESALRFNEKLSQVGNIASDGRPILGLDARDLLEMVLETDSQAYVIPAHVWTPWFSLFGSKSGFDSIEECFGDLAAEIFALETGLSSDPEMNWLWSALDRFTLVSNSDAHSGEKLAREANLFCGEKSYSGIRSALERKEGATKFLGTFEFYPEEGKYHLDGHRKCGVVLEPLETARLGGICPVCEEPLTIGVLNRVLALSDRLTPVRPEGRPGFHSLVPLPELLSEIFGVGPSSKKVMREYAALLRDHRSELDILRNVPVEDLQPFSKIFAEAIRRMRNGEVHRQSGYDGAYGKICMFEPKELAELRHGRMLNIAVREEREDTRGRRWMYPSFESKAKNGEGAQAISPNELQLSAILAGPGPVLVVAGPGTGKTQTLLGRVRHLLEQGVHPDRVLVVTYTRRAARELQDRLAHGNNIPLADTLHALALRFWISATGEQPVLLSEEGARRVFAAANPQLERKALKTAWNTLTLYREQNAEIKEDFFKQYQDQKARWNLVDYTDLLEFWASRIEQGLYISEFEHVLVDEVQDLSPLQFCLVRGLTRAGGHGFFAIGDPHQAIYSFRGGLRDAEGKIKEVWPEVKRIRLIYNYRSSQEILNFSAQLFSNTEKLVARQNLPASMSLFAAQTAEQEASWVATRVRELIGGTGHWQADTDARNFSPGDIAVLVRFKALIPLLESTLHKAGIPAMVPEAEPFFMDERVRVLLHLAAVQLGSSELDSTDLPACPDQVLSKGPLAMAAFFEETPPFDRVFWKTKPFLELEKQFRELGGWRDVLNMVRLESEYCEIRSRAQKVQIMTMHAAKGLEFEAVFLPCLEEGIMPFAGTDMVLGQKNAEGSFDLEEERRLLYVALTRAKRGLFLSHCATRRLFGKTLRLGLSSLVRGLSLDMLRKSTVKQRVRVNERQLSLF